MWNTVLHLGGLSDTERSVATRQDVHPGNPANADHMNMDAVDASINMYVYHVHCCTWNRYGKFEDGD